jgi:hypothetical protein
MMVTREAGLIRVKLVHKRTGLAVKGSVLYGGGGGGVFFWSTKQN